MHTVGTRPFDYLSRRGDDVEGDDLHVQLIKPKGPSAQGEDNP